MISVVKADVGGAGNEVEGAQQAKVANDLVPELVDSSCVIYYEELVAALRVAKGLDPFQFFVQ